MEQVITKLWSDESGDQGFRFDGGSSRFLVIAVVYLIGGDEADIEKELGQLRSKLGLTKEYEFKFSRCKDKFKEEFLKLLRKLPVKYKAIVVDKKAMRVKMQAQQLYCELMRRLLYDGNPPLKRAILVIDEAAAKIHHKEFNQVLKKYLSKNVIAKIRQKRSKNDAMIQVADMVAGSIFRKYQKGNDSYYQKAKYKETTLIEF